MYGAFFITPDYPAFCMHFRLFCTLFHTLNDYLHRQAGH